MLDLPDNKQRRAGASIAPGLLCLLGAFVLTGWLLGSDPMVRVLPGSTAMAINTAALFLATGAALLLARRQEPAARRAVAALSGLLLALPAAILWQHASGMDLGIDWAGVHAALGDGHAKPGRTAPNACVGFLGAAAVLLLLPRLRAGHVGAYRVCLALSWVVLAIGLSAFAGYLLELEALYRVARYNQMAALTALGMSAVGVGLLQATLASRRAAVPLARIDARRVTALGAALLTLFAAATALTAFGLLKEGYEASAADNVLQAARKSALGASALLEKSALLNSSLAGRPVVSRAVTRLNEEPGDALAAEQLLREQQSFLALGITAMRIEGANGALGAAGRDLLPDDTPGVALPGERGGGHLLWRNGYVHRTEHLLTDRGNRVGRVVLERDLPELTAFLTEARRGSSTSDVVLCGRGGQDTFFCFPSRFFTEPLRGRLMGADGKPAWPMVRALLTGDTAAVSQKDARGVPVLAGVVPLPRFQLALVEKLETQELYLPLRERLPLLALVMLAFIGIGTLLLRRGVQPIVQQVLAERGRMKAVLDSANDAFVAVGRDGLVTQWSVQARHMFGFEPAEAVGREFTALLGGAQGLVIPSQLWDGSGGGMRRVEVAAVRKDGERLPVELSIAPFSDGVTDGASIFVRDLTQQRAAERQLEQVRQDLLQAQKLDAIGKLTGGVAHDFNNVLQVIGGNLALLQSQLAQQPAARRLAEAASSAVDRGAKLSSQLLAFARRQPLQPLPLNVNRRVQAMDELLRRSLGERVEIETVLAAGLWTTLADPNQLENVLLNLAINARDAMPEGGRLTIETGNAVLEESYTAGFEALEPGQYVMVAVSDTGTGMPPEVAARAFEPFFTTKGEGKGTGLGLSMAYGFAKQSGGHIRIYSEPGSGTTIKLYLPRSLEPEAQIEASRAGPVRGGDETVLVVEDDLPVQTAVVNMLQALGYRTLRANDAQSALEILQSGEPVDLLFTDVVMPGPLRSPELAREARRLRPALAVLFTSGYTQNAIVHGGRLDPGVELLSKPYRQEELARKVRKLLDARPVQAEPAAPQAARVLLVEDEADLRASTHELLQLLGIEVDSVATAEEARERLATGRYGLLLTDLSLPGESGSELAAWAAAHDAQLRIVFASGLGGNFTPPPGLRFTILAKPYGVEELQRVLQGSVGQPAGETA